MRREGSWEATKQEEVMELEKEVILCLGHCLFQACVKSADEIKSLSSQSNSVN